MDGVVIGHIMTSFLNDNIKHSIKVGELSRYKFVISKLKISL